MTSIALLGLGIMGSGMAANWLAKGYPVTVWNRTAAKARPLVEKGARLAATARAAAKDADVVVSMVADDAASRAVWLGEDGALAAVKPGAAAIEMSTVSPDWMQELASKARERGLAMLDSPVGGSKAAAAAGQLVLFVGGDKATLDRVRPVLEAVSKEINHLGPAGAGTTWKLINNMMVAIEVAASAEAIALAEKAGFDRALVTRLIGEGGIGSPLIKMKMTRMSALEFGDPDFMIRHMVKDLGYAARLAASLGVSPDIASAAAGYYARAEAEHGDKDFAAVLAALRG
jgi:3-hydroxyisobutyrate dehydrogenase